MPSGSHIEVDKADAGNGVLNLDASAYTAAAPLPPDAHHKSNNDVDCQEDIDTSMKMDDGVDDVNEEEEAVDDEPAVAKITPKKASVVSPTSQRKPPSKKSTKGSSTKSSSTTTKKKTKKSPATPPTGNDRPSSKAAVATPSDSAEKAKKKGNKKQKSEPKKPTTTLHSFFSKAGPSAAKKKGGSIKSGSSSISSSAAKIATAKANASSAATSDDDCKIISSEVSTVKVQKSTTKASNDKLTTTKKPTKKTKGKGGEEGVKATAGKPSKKSTNTSKKNAASAKDVLRDMSSSTTTVVSDTAEELDDSPMWAVAMASRTHSAGGGTRRRGSRGGRAVEGDVGSCDVLSAAVDTSDGGGTEKVAVEEVVIADESDGDDKMDTENQDINNTIQPIDSSSVAVSKDVQNNTPGSTSEDVTALDGVSANEEDIEELGDLLVSPEKAADSSVIAVIDTTVDVAADPAVEQVVTEAMEEDDCMALVGDPNFLSLGDIPDANDAEDMNIDCEEEEKAPVPEGTADDSANNNADSDDDDTVAVEEPATENVSTDADVDGESNVATETTQPQIDNDVVEEREEPSAQEEDEDDDLIVVDVSKASVLEELPAEGITPKKFSTSSQELSNEKVEVQTTSKDNTEKATKSKKKSTKPTPKSRTKTKKTPAASSSSSKSPKSKAATATKGMDIMASFKKQAALSPKRKSTDTPIRNKVSTSSSTPGAVFKSDAKSPAKPLSEENASRLRDFTTLREKYVARATEIGNRPTSDDFEEESLCLDALTVDEKSVELAEDGGFPDKLLNHLQLIVQGRCVRLKDTSNSC